MEHYRALKWGAGALLLSPLVLSVAGYLYFGLQTHPLLQLLTLVGLETYLGFIFYCVLCVPIPRRILLLASIVLLLAVGSLLFDGLESAAFVLVPGTVLCILGGLPRWVGLGVGIFIANTLLLLSPSLLRSPAPFELLVYVFLAYCGLGVAALPYLDWGAYLKTGNRNGRKVNTSS